MFTLLQRLEAHCRAYSGINDKSRRGRIKFTVLESSLDIVVRADATQSPPTLLLRCSDATRQKLEAQTSAVRISKQMKWDRPGWKWTDVVLDGSLDESTLIDLLDQSYQIIINSFDDEKRFLIELIGQKLPPRQVLTKLVRHFDFQDHQAEIERLLQPAFLLRTRPIEQAALAPGQSRIGGLPDLPADCPWPAYRNQPLAFLAQINLSELPPGDNALPRSGMLYLFSVYGWRDEQSADPPIPSEDYAPDWTRILHWDVPISGLVQREAPADLHIYPSAAIEMVPILTLPRNAEEPAVAALKWDEETAKKFEKLSWKFTDVCQYGLGQPLRHLLLGYADFVQSFIPTVSDRNLRLLLQISSDNNAAMGWGDGGNLYFWITPDALAKRDFDDIFTDYQCG